MKVLIADDDGDFRRMLHDILVKWGFEVVAVPDGTQALEVLRADQVDLILTDINMPSMDGLEFVRQLKAQNLAPGRSRARSSDSPGAGTEVVVDMEEVRCWARSGRAAVSRPGNEPGHRPVLEMGRFIPGLGDQDRCAHFRRPRDIMSQGRSMSLFQALQQWSRISSSAWLGRCRRLAKDWENLNCKALAFLRLASIRLMLRKLCNPA